MLKLPRPMSALLMVTLPFAATGAEVAGSVGPVDARAAAAAKAGAHDKAVEEAFTRALATPAQVASTKEAAPQEDPPRVTPPATARSVARVAGSQPDDPRGRHGEVRNDLQIGPQSLVLDRLAAQAELSPDSLQAGFAYRLALDDAGAAHHLFGASLESARCQDDAKCGLRWFGFAGISPKAAQGFAVPRGAGGKPPLHTGHLGWSAALGAAGVSYPGRLLSFAADGQLEALSIDYARSTGSAASRTSRTLDQLRLRGTTRIAVGPWSGSLRIAGYVYSGTAPESFQLVPLRGALVDDDSAGLAAAPQSFQARLEGRCDASSGFSVAASYGYLSYVGPYWTSANLISAGIAQRIGHLRAGFGLVYQAETHRSEVGSSTLFGTATLGASY